MAHIVLAFVLAAAWASSGRTEERRFTMGTMHDILKIEAADPRVRQHKNSPAAFLLEEYLYESYKDSHHLSFSVVLWNPLLASHSYYFEAAAGGSGFAVSDAARPQCYTTPLQESCKNSGGVITVPDLPSPGDQSNRRSAAVFFWPSTEGPMVGEATIPWQVCLPWPPGIGQPVLTERLKKVPLDISELSSCITQYFRPVTPRACLVVPLDTSGFGASEGHIIYVGMNSVPLRRFNDNYTEERLKAPGIRIFVLPAQPGSAP